MAHTYSIGERLVSPVATLERLPIGNPGSLLPTGLPYPEAQVGFPSNMPYVEHGAWWALFNTAGSGKIVTVKEVALTPLQSRTTSTVSNYTMDRISALAGGSDVVAAPLDTNNAALPAGLLCRLNADVTLTGARLRTTMDLQQLNAARAVPYPIWKSSTSGNAEIYSQRGADVQGMVLRENQGLSILSTGSVSRENYTLAVSALFTVGAESYLIREIVQTGAFPSLLAIFNSTGSGIVVTIRNVVVSEVTSDEVTLRRMTLESISGLHPNSYGTPADFIPHDSANPALPAHVRSVLKAGVLQMGNDAGMGGPRRNQSFLRRQVGAIMGVGPGLATGPNVGGNGLSPDFNRILRSDFVLREGEGIALLQKDDTSSWGNGYWLNVLITVEDNITPGYSGAAISYVS